MTTLKYESSKSMRSAAIDATSSNEGTGGELKEYEMSEGWIMTTELVMFSRFNIMRKYAVSSGLLLNTCVKKTVLTTE